jgi:NADH-quinone oxidoreductase E subunit
MAAATPTSYTDQVEYSAEVAEFSPEIIAEMDEHLAKYPPERKRSALIPILLLVIQRERGWVDNAGVNFLAKYLGLEVTDIWETATFYSMFNMHQVGRNHIQICKTLSCKIMGEPEITDHICSKLGIKPGETTKDGKFTVSLVECLGSCGTAPMMQIGFDYHEDLTIEKVDKILDGCE